jgi:hypothetical protein
MRKCEGQRNDRGEEEAKGQRRTSTMQNLVASCARSSKGDEGQRVYSWKGSRSDRWKVPEKEGEGGQKVSAQAEEEDVLSRAETYLGVLHDVPVKGLLVLLVDVGGLLELGPGIEGRKA